MASRAFSLIAVAGVLSCVADGGALGQESDDVFILDFEGPDVLHGAPGETVSGVYFGILRHSGPGGGALGWATSMIAENASFTRISLGYRESELQTDAARHMNPESSFQLTEMTAAGTGECFERRGAISSVALSMDPDQPAALPPRSSSSIFYVTLEREVEVERQLAVIRFADGCMRGQPVHNIVTQAVGDGWRPVVPIKGTRTVEFIPDLPFLRGDTNASGRVDISDAIRIFMTLFQGADPFPCLDAADTNDDGSTDISDGIGILNDFFIEGTAIPAPGPFSCGPDPTGDELSCPASSCG